MWIIPDDQDLKAALAAAASAHHDYEVHALQGVRDELWAGFYAAYVLGRLGDFTTPTRLAHLLEAAPESHNWAETAAEYVLQALATA